jgi:hypothetical protein
MLKENMLTISVFCLAISIIISSSIFTKGVRVGLSNIGSGVNNGLNNISSNINSSNDYERTEKENFDLSEARLYLRLSEDELKGLVNNRDSGIPYIKIGYKYVFNKKALDKWLETARVEME